MAPSGELREEDMWSPGVQVNSEDTISITASLLSSNKTRSWTQQSGPIQS